MSHRPGFRPKAKVQPYVWVDSGTQKRTPGIALLHRRTVLAHLTADEAREMADKLHDLVDTLSNDQAPKIQKPIYTSQTLTAADGTEEPPLPATIAD